MTIDDFVKDLEEIIEENKNIDEGELGLLYCDDTECIEEHKSRLNEYLNKCEQLVKYLKMLKGIKQIITEYEECDLDDAYWYLGDIKSLLEDIE